MKNVREIGMGGEGKTRVYLRNKMVVRALTSPLKQHQNLPLSNLDLLLPQEYFSIFLCYKNPLNEGNDNYYTFSNVVTILKEALSICLVSFYIFAGEMSQNNNGEPHVICNNHGVDFVDAFANVNFKDLDFYNSHQSVDGVLIPEKKHGLLAIQVTQLKCGGLVISCTFDHRVSDAYSANMFLLSWVEIAQSQSSSFVPSFDRTMLSGRKTPSFDLSVVNTYVPETSSPSEDLHSNGMNLTHQAENAISRIYYMKAGNITKLQSLANITNSEGCAEFRKKTKLEAFSAFLWKLIASGDQASEDKSCKMGIVVDGRGTLSSENEGRLWNLYIGNVLSIPFGEMEIEELKKKPINLVADSIQQFLKPAISREHFLGLVDYVETQRPKKLLAKIYATNAINDEAAVVISSGLRFPIRTMDFGWGLPVFGSFYYSWKGKAGYVMPIPSARGNGDWIVYMHLLERQFQLIENCEDGILKPLTSEYLLKE